MDDPELLSLVDATGAVLSYDGVLTVRGEVDLDAGPAPGHRRRARGRRQLRDVDRPGRRAGARARRRLLASPACSGSAPTPDRWLLWFRPEQERVVDWGGDPTNKQLAAAEGPHVRLSPRRSFEKWRQVVRGRSTPWAPWKLEVADALGKHLIGLILSRSRDQIAMAESIQRSVVSDEPPHFDGIELAARYQPASTFQLGGDWWDAFPLADGRIVFVVGDVAGHGVSAASAMTQVRTALRAYLFEGHSPATCLDRLDLLMAGLLDQRVATAVLAVLDPSTGRVELTSAGHPPPMLITRGDGRRRRPPGPPAARRRDRRAPRPSSSTCRPAPPCCSTPTASSSAAARTCTSAPSGCASLAADTYADSDLQAWVDRLIELHDDGGGDDTTVLALRLA